LAISANLLSIAGSNCSLVSLADLAVAFDSFAFKLIIKRDRDVTVLAFMPFIVIGLFCGLIGRAGRP